jgi:hypothetical protein
MKKKKVEEYIAEISKQNGVDISEDIKKEIFKMLDENKILYKFIKICEIRDKKTLNKTKFVNFAIQIFKKKHNIK